MRLSFTQIDLYIDPWKCFQNTLFLLGISNFNFFFLKMSGYPNQPSGYPNQPSGYGYGYGGTGGYGAPPPTAQPYNSSAYGHPQSQTQQPYAPVAAPYGVPSAPYGSAQGEKPPKDKPNQSYGGAGGGHQSYGGAASGGHGYPPPSAYGSPFASLLPSAFPPGTDPSIVACFQVADQDGSGFIDDKELQGVLSSYNQKFSIRTVHLLMYHFTNTNTRKIGNLTFPSIDFLFSLEIRHFLLFSLSFWNQQQ